MHHRALLCTIGVSAQDNDSIYEKNLLKPGTPAPIIPLDGKDGSKYGLHQYQKMMGNYMAVYFYAGWCPDCRKVAPDFVQKIQKDCKSLNISPFYVSFDKDSTTFKEYREKEDMHGMVFLETKKWKESKVAMDYHLEWIPLFPRIIYTSFNTHYFLFILLILLDKISLELIGMAVG